SAGMVVTGGGTTKHTQSQNQTCANDFAMTVEQSDGNRRQGQHGNNSPCNSRHPRTLKEGQVVQKEDSTTVPYMVNVIPLTRNVTQGTPNIRPVEIASTAERGSVNDG